MYNYIYIYVYYITCCQSSLVFYRWADGHILSDLAMTTQFGGIVVASAQFMA